MSTTSDKFSAAWFEHASTVTTDSKGSHTLTNNNTTGYSGGLATFVAASANSFDATAATGIKFAGGIDYFIQARVTLTDKVTGFGQTILSQDDSGSTRVQFLKYLNGTDRFSWETWAETGSTGEGLLVLDESPTEDVELTIQVWFDADAGTGGLGRAYGRIGLGTLYEIDMPDAGWDSSIPFRIGSLENLSNWYWNGSMNQLLVGTTIPDSTERDWIIDKTWAQIVTGMTTPTIARHAGRRFALAGNYRGLVS